MTMSETYTTFSGQLCRNQISTWPIEIVLKTELPVAIRHDIN